VLLPNANATLGTMDLEVIVQLVTLAHGPAMLECCHHLRVSVVVREPGLRLVRHRRAACVSIAQLARGLSYLEQLHKTFARIVCLEHGLQVLAHRSKPLVRIVLLVVGHLCLVHQLLLIVFHAFLAHGQVSWHLAVIPALAVTLVHGLLLVEPQPFRLVAIFVLLVHGLLRLGQVLLRRVKPVVLEGFHQRSELR
jgi:hypothetical protein